MSIAVFAVFAVFLERTDFRDINNCMGGANHPMSTVYSIAGVGEDTVARYAAAQNSRHLCLPVRLV